MAARSQLVARVVCPLFKLETLPICEAYRAAHRTLTLASHKTMERKEEIPGYNVSAKEVVDWTLKEGLKPSRLSLIR